MASYRSIKGLENPAQACAIVSVAFAAARSFIVKISAIIARGGPASSVERF
jgi:hypothetical protein